MKTDARSENLLLRLWFVTHRTRDALRSCEDRVFGEFGLTAEQYAVLAVMKVLGGSVRITDLARGLERTPNSVSMIVDRMVKAGLVKRARDRGDRRVVYVAATDKGENAFRPATKAGLELVQTIMSPLSDEDKRTFLTLHETVKYKALEYLDAGADIEEMKEDEITNRPDLVKQLREYLSSPAARAKPQSGKKKKATG
jgi:DNA-binding MarR family transcriptional regulator